MNSFNYTDFFGNQHEAISCFMNNASFCENKKIEIMVHPDYCKEGFIVDRINDNEFLFKYPKELERYKEYLSC